MLMGVLEGMFRKCVPRLSFISANTTTINNMFMLVWDNEKSYWLPDQMLTWVNQAPQAVFAYKPALSKGDPPSSTALNPKKLLKYIDWSTQPGPRGRDPSKCTPTWIRGKAGARCPRQADATARKFSGRASILRVELRLSIPRAISPC